MGFLQQLEESSNFHFSNPTEKKIGTSAIVFLQADLIRQVKGTCKDKNGDIPIIRNYKGKVKIDKSHIYDLALAGPDGNQYAINIKKKGKKTIYPMYGYYRDLLKSDLKLDIDKKGDVWLTKPSFYEISLHEKLKELKAKLHSIKNEIKEVYDELEELEHEKDYEYMAADQENKLYEQQDNYYSSMQDELGRDEENRMDIETDGFWRIQDE